MARRSLTDDEFLDSRQRRRMKNEDRMLGRLEQREAAAALDRAQAISKLGQLCRGGVTVYYSYPPGGKYRESTNPADLV